jgi:hypothetical protein
VKLALQAVLLLGIVGATVIVGATLLFVMGIWSYPKGMIDRTTAT